MNARSVLLVAAALVSSLLLAACSKPGSRGFHRVELTKEDLVSLFDVPLAHAHVDKFQWSLGREHFVRAVVERSDDKGTTWTEFRTFPRDIAVVEATLIYKLDLIEPAAETPRYVLRVRLGGRSIGASGWGESACMLEFPQLGLQTESHFDDPNRILTVTSGTRAYRLRLEAQEKPFAKR